MESLTEKDLERLCLKMKLKGNFLTSAPIQQSFAQCFGNYWSTSSQVKNEKVELWKVCPLKKIYLTDSLENWLQNRVHTFTPWSFLTARMFQITTRMPALSDKWAWVLQAKFQPLPQGLDMCCTLLHTCRDTCARAEADVSLVSQIIKAYGCVLRCLCSQNAAQVQCPILRTWLKYIFFLFLLQGRGLWLWMSHCCMKLSQLCI